MTSIRNTNWTPHSIEILNDGNKGYILTFYDKHRVDNYALAISRKRKNRNSGKFKDRITGNNYYFNFTNAQKILSSEDKIYTTSTISQYWNTKSQKNRKERIFSLIKKSDPKTALTYEEAIVIDDFFHNNIHHWKKNKKINVHFKRSSLTFPRNLRVLSCEDGKIRLFIMPNDENVKRGMSKRIIFCTEWIEGMEYVFGTILNNKVENKSFKNELDCYKFLKEFPGIADPIHLISNSPPYQYYQTRYFSDLGNALENRNLNIREKKAIAREIIESVAKLSLKGVQHGDIKLENIFLTFGPPYKPKLADFGLTKLENPLKDIPENCTDDEKEEIEKDQLKFCSKGIFNEGTNGYMPPETELCYKLINEKKAIMHKPLKTLKLEVVAPILSNAYDKRDIFAVGVLFLEILSTKFSNKIKRPHTKIAEILMESDYPDIDDYSSFYEKIRKKIGSLILPIENKYKQDIEISYLIRIVKKMLEPDPQKRISAKKLLREISFAPKTSLEEDTKSRSRSHSFVGCSSLSNNCKYDKVSRKNTIDSPVGNRTNLFETLSRERSNSFPSAPNITLNRSVTLLNLRTKFSKKK